MNFDKAHTQPLSLLRLDSSTYIETLLYVCTIYVPFSFLKTSGDLSEDSN